MFTTILKQKVCGQKLVLWIKGELFEL